MTGILDKLNPLYTQIANGLGELAGNEAFWDTIEHNFPTGRRVDPPPHSRMFTAEFPVPGPHGFTLTHAYWGADFTQEGQPPPIETERALAKAAEQAWFQAAKGYSADAGWDTVLRNWGIDVWEADPSAMSGSVDGLVSVAQLAPRPARARGRVGRPRQPVGTGVAEPTSRSSGPRPRSRRARSSSSGPTSTTSARSTSTPPSASPRPARRSPRPSTTSRPTCSRSPGRPGTTSRPRSSSGSSGSARAAPGPRGSSTARRAPRRSWATPATPPASSP